MHFTDKYVFDKNGVYSGDKVVEVKKKLSFFSKNKEYNYYNYDKI